MTNLMISTTFLSPMKRTLQAYCKCVRFVQHKTLSRALICSIWDTAHILALFLC